MDEQKSVYLFDETPKSDSFEIHTNIATALANQLDAIVKDESAQSVESSFNIGLFGDWGSGKSYIIQQVFNLLEKRDDIATLYIDVWKYNDMPLLRSILFEMLDNLKRIGVSKRAIKKEQDKYKVSLYIGETQSNLTQRVKKIFTIGWSVAAGLTALSLFLSFWKNNPTLSAFAIFPLPIVLFIDQISRSMKKFFSDNVKNLEVLDSKLLPIISPEQFSEKFIEILGKYRKVKDGIKKFLIVFDNIDRCNDDIAYQVFSTIKTYIGRSECIYLIPCDDIAIRSFINNKYKNAENCENKSDEFIDKLFNTYFRIPKLREEDRDLFIKECFEKVSIALGQQDIEDISAILYYAYIGKTPRQIKRFVNDFISYYRIAETIDKERQFLLDNIKVFAGMIAIKQVYPDFENMLIDNPANLYYITQYTYDEYYKKKEGGEVGYLVSLSDFLRIKEFVNESHLYKEEINVENYVYFKKTNDSQKVREQLYHGDGFIRIDVDNIKSINRVLGQTKASEFRVHTIYNLSEYFMEYGMSPDIYSRDFNDLKHGYFSMAFSNMKKNKYTRYFVIEEYMNDCVIDESVERIDHFYKTIMSEASLEQQRLLKSVIVENVMKYKMPYYLFEYAIQNSYFDKYDVKQVLEKWDKKEEPYNRFVSTVINHGRFDLLDSEFVEKYINSIVAIDDLELIKDEFEIVEKLPGGDKIAVEKFDNTLTTISQGPLQYDQAFETQLEYIDNYLRLLPNESFTDECTRSLYEFADKLVILSTNAEMRVDFFIDLIAKDIFSDSQMTQLFIKSNTTITFPTLLSRLFAGNDDSKIDICLANLLNNDQAKTWLVTNESNVTVFLDESSEGIFKKYVNVFIDNNPNPGRIYAILKRIATCKKITKAVSASIEAFFWSIYTTSNAAYNFASILNSCKDMGIRFTKKDAISDVIKRYDVDAINTIEEILILFDMAVLKKNDIISFLAKVNEKIVTPNTNLLGQGGLIDIIKIFDSQDDIQTIRLILDIAKNALYVTKHNDTKAFGVQIVGYLFEMQIPNLDFNQIISLLEDAVNRGDAIGAGELLERLKPPDEEEE